MNTTPSNTINLIMMLLIFTVLNSQSGYAQSTDSLTHSPTSNRAIQFQLIGGIGVYYIGDWNPASHYRIGADVSLNHSKQTGSYVEYSMQTEPPPSPTTSSGGTSQPEQTSNSYQVSLSGLYLQTLADYKNTSIYFGVGPIVSYSWSRTTSKYPHTSTGTYDTTISVDNNEYTTKASAIGPLAIIGLRSQLIDHVALTAEIGLSAVYQWTMQSNSYISTYGTPASSSTFSNGDVVRLDGWAVSLNAIRIGLIVGL